jgi:hypothetical protein
MKYTNGVPQTCQHNDPAHQDGVDAYNNLSIIMGHCKLLSRQRVQQLVILFGVQN